MEQPLTIWAVSDGRAGIANQVLGLAEAVARLRPSAIVIKTVSWRAGAGRQPTWLNLAPRLTLNPTSGITPPWPDMWIAAGRATLPLSIRIGRWSQGRAFVVQAQDPRLPARLFDVVVPPRHDRVEGANVIPITGSPHRVTPQRLQAEHALFEDRLASLPGPRVAVMIGGKSKAFDLPDAQAAVVAEEIRGAVQTCGGSLLMSFSRRTPVGAEAVMTERLADLPGIIWDGAGPNPYFAFLAAADFILVTEDSANMAAEAASTGKPVLILPMRGEHPKFRALQDDLERRGAARRFDGTLPAFAYEPLRETDRAAAEILARFDARAARTSR